MEVQKVILIFDNMVKIGNKGWMAGGNVNSLFCYDFDTNEIEEKAKYKRDICYDPKKGMRNFHIFSRTIKAENRLVLMPQWTNEIAVYDLEHESEGLQYYRIPGIGVDGEVYLGFYSNGFVYFAIKRRNKLYRFDLNKKCVEDIELAKRLNLPENGNEKVSFWNPYSFFDGETIYMSINDTNKVVVYDTINDKASAYTIGEENIYDIYGDKDDIWAATTEGTIIRWNKNAGEVFRYKLTGDDLLSEKKYRLFVNGGNTYVCGPYRDNEILVISHVDNSVSRKKARLFENIVVNNNNSWLSNFISNSFICTKEMFAQYYNGAFCLTDSLEDSFHEPILLNMSDYLDEFVYFESKWLGVRDWFQLKQNESYIDDNINVGKRIFEIINNN
jgi:hypothetical protein